MIKMHKIKCPLSKVDIEIYISSGNEFKDKVKKLYNVDINEIDKYDGYATKIEQDSGFSKCLIWVESVENMFNQNTIRIISHEVLHTAFNLYEYMNAIIDNTNQEAFIYFYMRLFDMAMEKIFKNEKV